MHSRSPSDSSDRVGNDTVVFYFKHYFTQLQNFSIVWIPQRLGGYSPGRHFLASVPVFVSVSQKQTKSRRRADVQNIASSLCCSYGVQGLIFRQLLFHAPVHEARGENNCLVGPASILLKIKYFSTASPFLLLHFFDRHRTILVHALLMKDVSILASAAHCAQFLYARFLVSPVLTVLCTCWKPFLVWLFPSIQNWILCFFCHPPKKYTMSLNIKIPYKIINAGCFLFALLSEF